MDALEGYVTPDEASDYLLGRHDSEAWESATEEQQEAALSEASDRVDLLPWRGLRLVYAQEREWPRKGVDPRAWNLVRRAVIYEALEILKPTSKRQALAAEGVTSYRIGPLAETYASPKSGGGVSLKSASALHILRPYMALSGGVR